MAGRINGYMLPFGKNFTGQHIHLRHTVDFIPEHFNTDNRTVESRREHFNRIAVDAERTAL